MKKIFSFIVAALAAITMSATEQTLWEGDWSVSWDYPEEDEHREWKLLGQEDFAALDADSKLYFYLGVEEAEYHKCQFDKYDWTALPGTEAVEFSEDTRLTLILTQEIKDAIASDGFAIHGHGFKLTKVTLYTEDEEPEEGVLWSGNWYVSWEDGTPDEHKEWKGIGQENFAEFAVNDKLYITMELNTADEYHEYKIDNWAWETLPGQEQTTLSEDTEVEVVITQEIKDAVAAEGFAVHGHGFFVTKARVVSATTAIDNVSISNNGIRYNLLGQEVDENYKGVVILNGQKMIVR